MTIQTELTELNAQAILALQAKAVLLPPISDLPEGYFEGMADAVFAKIELENIAPHLALLPKKQVKNSLPDAYFDDFETAFFTKLNNTETPELQIVSIKKSLPIRIRLWAGAAVAAAVVVGAGVFIGINNSNNNTTNTVADSPSTLTNEVLLSAVSPSDAVAYLHDHAQEIDETMLADARVTASPQDIYPINSKDIQQYLDENGGID